MRNLREKKLLTTGARGVNAPDLTCLDAARVLIAHIVDGNPGKAAPRIVDKFGPLPWSNPGACEDLSEYEPPFTLGALVPDQPKNTFEHCVAGLIRVFAEHRDGAAFRLAGGTTRDGTLRNAPCRVEVLEEDETAFVFMGDVQYAFFCDGPAHPDWTPQDSAETRLGRQVTAMVNQEVFAAIAHGFRATEGA